SFKLFRAAAATTAARRMAQAAAQSSRSSSSQASNRLHLSRSPYLAQHANDPVHWQPWGDEAFALAKARDQLVFLSIGYSTCHWCHVMHRESFQNADIAKLLNDNFVSIKLDREERPDVDRVYMNFVLALGVGGGWPLSVWLTPDKRPIFGGTYFPPENRYFGRPGFASVLQSLSDSWRNKRDQVETQGTEILAALRKHAVPPAPPSAAAFDPSRPAALCLRQLRDRFDSELGGFGRAPKFPQPSLLAFLLRLAGLRSAADPAESAEALAMCRLTLDCMARGGIHDHVNGGFHRYSTDAKWHVPHFEKMLYDQAQLCSTFAVTSRLCAKEDAGTAKELADTAVGIVEYVCRELSHPAGGFYSAQDADSLPEGSAEDAAGGHGHGKKEGAFCVWTWGQLAAALEGGSIGDVPYLKAFAAVYSCAEAGNVDPYQDPHDELRGQNVLIRRKAWRELAQQLGLSEQQLRAGITDCLLRLREVRAKRPPPHLDDKLLTCWNSMMISALAQAGRLLNRPDWLERARRGAEFIRCHLWREDTRTLYRVAYPDGQDGVTLGPTPVKAFLDDHAQLIGALLQLYRATLHQPYLAWARQLQAEQDAAFWCSEAKAYFDTSHQSADAGDAANAAAPELPLRLLDDHDGAEPCGNSVSAVNLASLRAFDDNSGSYSSRGGELLNRFSQTLGRQPMALTEMASACLLTATGPPATLVLAAPAEDQLEPLLQAAWSSDGPVRRPDLMLMRPQDAGWCSGYGPIDGRAAAYLCRDFTCQLPVTEPAELADLLAGI
ncbi:hypothetical protein BOX15_Mlig016554g1, partial [Macrostomum lignano]